MENKTSDINETNETNNNEIDLIEKDADLIKESCSNEALGKTDTSDKTDIQDTFEEPDTSDIPGSLDKPEISDTPKISEQQVNALHEKVVEKGSAKKNDYSALIALVLIILSTVSIFLKTSTVSKSAISKKGSGQAIGLIDISGVIRFTGQSSGFEGVMGYGNGAESVISKIDTFSKMDHVKGLILRIDSPGGTVGSAQEICSAIDRFRNVSKDGKPEKIVIASFGDTAASGAYYIASACDEIYANPGTLTGSIGVIMQGMEFSNLMGKAGVSEVTVKSGKYKDIGSPFRSMTTEEKSLLQLMVDDCFDQFVERVSTGRKLTRSFVTELGARIMTGRQAKEKGLVDTLGGLDSAIKRAGELTGLSSNPKVIKANSSSLDMIFGKYLGSYSENKTIEMIKGITGVEGFGMNKISNTGLTASYSGMRPCLIADIPGVAQGLKSSANNSKRGDK